MTPSASNTRSKVTGNTWLTGPNWPLVLLAFAFLTSSVTQAKGIVLSELEVDIVLSEEVQSALDNGVTLNFTASSAQKRQVLFITWAGNKKAQQFALSRHALSNHYLLHTPFRSAPKSFSSLRRALDQLERDSLALFRQTAASQTARPITWIHRLNLDIYALPSPMRLQAFWSQDWELDSGWSS